MSKLKIYKIEHIRQEKHSLDPSYINGKNNGHHQDCISSIIWNKLMSMTKMPSYKYTEDNNWNSDQQYGGKYWLSIGTQYYATTQKKFLQVSTGVIMKLIQ